jgi:cobalt-zinc-cadmium resistance protein CzcA
VVVGAMLCTLFLTRYLTPVLYTFFPGPLGHGNVGQDLILGSHYTDEFLHGEHHLKTVDIDTENQDDTNNDIQPDAERGAGREED